MNTTAQNTTAQNTTAQNTTAQNTTAQNTSIISRVLDATLAARRVIGWANYVMDSQTVHTDVISHEPYVELRFCPVDPEEEATFGWYVVQVYDDPADGAWLHAVSPVMGLQPGIRLD